MILFIFFVFHSAIFSPDHAITFDIIAPYHSVPLFEQFLFFLSDISPFSAKEYLKEILSNYSAINDTDFLCNLAESYISPSYYQLMYSQIENNYFLPRGEMFRRIALSIDNHSDLIISGNNDNFTFSNNEQINKGIKYTSDIEFGSSKIYVYANLHNKTVASEILLMITSKASFVLRPFSRSNSINPKLSGYGFELSANNKKNNSIDNFSTADYSKYKMVTDETIGRLDGIPPSYVNPILYQRLGPKFANYLRKRNESIPELLRDITSNYPLFIPLILSSSETKEDQISFQKVSNLLDLKPYSISFLNGRHIQISHTDLFNLFDILHQEHNFNAILERKYKIDHFTIKEIAETQMIPSDNLILDYQSPYIIYLNNLETDSQYENWTTDVNELYNITAKFPQIKKNLLNYVLYANPTTQDGATSLFEMVLMMQQNYPSRFGFMPFFNLGDKFERKVAYAFSYLATQNQIEAIQYLINVYEKIGIDTETKKINPINKNEFKYVFNEMTKSADSEVTWDMLYFLFDSESLETQRLINTYQYLKEHGIDKQTILLNGRYIQTPNFSPSTLNLEFHTSFLYLQTLFTKYNIRSLENFDIMSFFKQTTQVINTIDQRIYYSLPRGINIYNKKLSTQVEFCDFLPKINWNCNYNNDFEDSTSFIWIFGPSDTNLTTFINFMKEYKHVESIIFSFNPPIPDSVLHINKSIITLVFNGRVYENANINDIEFLVNLELWCNEFIVKPLSPIFYKLKYKRRECMIYLYCIYVDWMMNGVSRGSISDDIWRINSSLIYKPSPKPDSFGLTWEMIADPFSSDFQKIAPIINYFDKRKLVDLRIVLVPPKEISSSNLNVLSSFYRMSIGDEKTCVFTLLNETTSYSVVQHLPNSWLIENLRSSFDMSNICINNMRYGIHSAVFLLSSLVLDGSCFTEFGDVAEGAEISIFDANHEAKDTTIIMKINGYWQLKVKYPGQYLIEISGIKTKLLFQNISFNFLYSSFSCPFNRIELKYKPAFEHYQIKDLSRYNHRSKKRNNDCLNIFSVCDGFKSEDMLTKMIISIVNNTNSTQKIKFWFIRSFLSPQFKETLHKLKMKYSINYYFTDYKWPNWLKSQSIRSNNALCYKILFLDLLFKDEKGRVLYIDPSSIVKRGTDIFELFESYSFFENNYYSTSTLAFPSFSDTRIESEPLRFWRDNYWISLLHNKQYLDTDLFLVDLNRFKESGNADLIRYIYQIISIDPTSKSTLDQNLINFIQMQIPIKIFPDYYYGCDLWNDDMSMKNVKIVHLCNNPLNNLSEFERANKYISEWPDIQKEAQEIKSEK